MLRWGLRAVVVQEEGDEPKAFASVNWVLSEDELDLETQVRPPPTSPSRRGSRLLPHSLSLRRPAIRFPDALRS